MDAILHRLIENNFSELPGMTLDASIPLPEYLVNEILEASLAQNKNIEYCRVSIAAQNRVSINLKTPLWPWPYNLKLKLFHSVDFSDSPKVRAFLENGVLIGRLGALFQVLPAGIVLYKDQVSVDIGTFLQTPEQKRLLELIKSVEILTEPGQIIFKVSAER